MKSYSQRLISILLLSFLLFHNMSHVAIAQTHMDSLRHEINDLSLEIPTGFGEYNTVNYTFIYAGCYCAISQATTGKKKNTNTITTFSFNLTDLTDGQILVGKPKDQNFEAVSEDIWSLEIGTFDVLVQNTEWELQQSKTNHFYVYVEGLELRDRIIDLWKKVTKDCEGSISEVSVSTN